MTIEAINIDTKEKFDWMIREMQGLNKSKVTQCDLSQNNKKERKKNIEENLKQDIINEILMEYLKNDYVEQK
jgi:hypothetical protein